MSQIDGHGAQVFCAQRGNQVRGDKDYDAHILSKSQWNPSVL